MVVAEDGSTDVTLKMMSHMKKMNLHGRREAMTVTSMMKGMIPMLFGGE
jgi:hypothetical protein